jgi:hypothetical protein
MNQRGLEKRRDPSVSSFTVIHSRFHDAVDRRNPSGEKVASKEFLSLE